MCSRRTVTIAVASLVVLLVAVAGFVALRYFNIGDAVREVVVRRLEALTGRDVEIRGPFDVVPSLTPTVAAEEIVVANAPWGSRPAMLTAKRIEVELQLVPLLWDAEVVIDRLVVSGADLLLETGPKGQVNWRFSKKARPGPGLLIDDASVEDSRLTWHDIETGRTETAAIDRFTWRAADPMSALTVAGAGTYRSRPFTLAGQLGPPADLFAARKPYPVALEATLGDIRARIEGQLVPPSGLDLAVKVEGTTLAGLSPLVGFNLPTTPNPYRLAGRITGSLTDLRIEGIAAKVADSTLSGSLAVRRPGQQAPRIDGQLTASRLNLDRLIALVQNATREARPQKSPPLQRTAATDKPAAEGLLPLDALNAFNAELALRINDLLIGGAEFRNASLSLVLHNGRLNIRDLTMQAAGGTVAGGAAVNASQPAAEVSVHLNAEKIEVAKLLSELGAPQDITTDVDIDLDIDSTGPSLDALLGNMQGNATVVAEGGQIQSVPLNRLVRDLDLLNILLPFWFKGNNAIRLNCLIGEFDISRGVAQTELLLDTPRMTLLGGGTVNLSKDTLDLRLQPMPKNQKLSTVVVPVHIEGKLSAPEIKPDVGAAVGPAIRGVLGGLLVPLNQIAALFGQETADACADALRQARDRLATASAGGAAAGGGGGAEAASDR